MFVYSVFDKKVMSFGQLYTAENDAAASRLLAKSIGTDTMLAFAPADYALYCLGEYDPTNGNVSGFSPIKLICEVLSLIKLDKQSESN